MSELVVAKEKPLFVSPHELVPLVRKLKGLSKKALQVLEQGLDSEDEKIRMMAAEKLLKFYTDNAERTEKDKLTKLILEVKAKGMIGAGSTADDDDTPALDFDNISPEFADAQNVVDMGDVSKIG